MTSKKIIFSEKPIQKQTEKMIDDWVLSKNDHDRQEKKKILLKRTTIHLSEEMRQKIKILAAKQGTTMTDIMIKAIEQYIL